MFWDWLCKLRVRPSYRLHKHLIISKLMALRSAQNMLHVITMYLLLWFHTGLSLSTQKRKNADMEDVKHIAEKYEQAGWRTVRCTNMHMLSPLTVMRRGFCSWGPGVDSSSREAITKWRVLGKRTYIGSLWPGFGCRANRRKIGAPRTSNCCALAVSHLFPFNFFFFML